jgi:hypothetical protein
MMGGPMLKYETVSYRKARWEPREAMTGPDASERGVVTLARDVRVVLEQVLEQVRNGDWEAASLRAVDLVVAARRVQNEIDFCSMNEWLERAKTA